MTKVNILNRQRFAMLLHGAQVKATLGLIFMMAFLGLSPAIAQTASYRDVFTVRGVSVDTTASNVTNAREQGLLAGRMAAFWKVIERLVAPEDIERIPTPTTGEIITMVRDFSVSDERSSAVRYLADLSVRFHPGPVQALLRSAGVSYTETVSKPLVVVPLYRENVGGSLLLWEESNLWRMAWEGPSADNGLVPFVIPLGDIDDLTTLSVEEAIAGNDEALEALSTRYRTGGELVAVAEVLAGNQALGANGLDEQADTSETINILMTLIIRHRDLPESQIVLSYAGVPREDMDDVLSGAAVVAADAVQNTWKIANRVAFNATSQITALVPLVSLEQWVGIKNKLKNVPLIHSIGLQAMTRDRAQITLVYAGNIDQFNLALAQVDLAITQKSGVWVIENLKPEDAALASSEVDQ